MKMIDHIYLMMSGESIDDIDENTYDFDALEKRFEEAINSVSPRSQSVFRYRYGFEDEVGHTMEDVEKVFDVSPEEVRQITATVSRRSKLPNIGNYIEHDFLDP